MAKAVRIERDPRAAAPGKPLDFHFGYALLRHPRVPARAKLLALAIGMAAVALVEFLELPIEEVIAFVLPFVGILGDVALDGVELFFGPILIASLLLPYLAPPAIVAQIRAERSGPGQSPVQPVIDI